MARAKYLFRKGHPKADELGMVLEEDLGDWDAKQKQKQKDQAKTEKTDGNEQGV